MPQIVKWGLIGPGSIAHQFAQDIRWADSAELQAVASRSEARAHQFADQYLIPQAYGSYEALLADPEVEAVYIATPHNSHLQWAEAALQAGKAVLCEKPITVTPAECKQLFRTAQQTGNYLMEGLWTYFLPAFRQAMQWLEGGKIGELRQVQASFGHPIPFDPKSRIYAQDLAGGVLLDMGIYPVALAYACFGEQPQQVLAMHQRAASGVEDELLAICQFPSGGAQWSTSFRQFLPNTGAIIGETGYILLPNFWQTRKAMRYEGDQLVETFEDTRRGGGFEFEIESASQDILAGRQASEIMSPATSLALQQTTAMVFKSMQG